MMHLQNRLNVLVDALLVQARENRLDLAGDNPAGFESELPLPDSSSSADQLA